MSETEMHLDFTRATRGTVGDNGYRIVVCPNCSRKGAFHETDSGAEVIHEQWYADSRLFRTIRNEISCPVSLDIAVRLMRKSTLESFVRRAARDAMNQERPGSRDEVSARFVAGIEELERRGYGPVAIHGIAMEPARKRLDAARRELARAERLVLLANMASCAALRMKDNEMSEPDLP